MRSSIISACVFLLAPAALAVALPPMPTQLSFGSFLDGDDDACPNLKVRCLKDGDITKIVGDIGEQSFCRVGLTCEQCHSKKNTLQCNTKYLKDCAGKCEAQGSPI